MFTPNFYIDSFQSLKRGLTDKVITDPVMNKAAVAFIDAQTAWAKMIVDNSTNITKHYFDQLAKTTAPKKSKRIENESV